MTNVIYKIAQKEKIRKMAEKVFTAVDSELREIYYLNKKAPKPELKAQYDNIYSLVIRLNNLMYPVDSSKDLNANKLHNTLKELAKACKTDIHHQQLKNYLASFINNQTATEQKQGMTTRFEIHIPMFSQKCPVNMSTEECPLRLYLANNTTFTKSAKSNLLAPNTNNWIQARGVIDTMYVICNKCHEDNKAR